MRRQDRKQRRGARSLLSLATLIAVSLALSACTGVWSVDPRDEAPVNAIHAALLPTGKVLLVEGSGNDWRKFDAGSFKTSLWDPVTRTHTDIPTPSDFFCAGHAALPDGRLLVAGGTSGYAQPSTNNNPAGLREAWIFDPIAEQYVPAADMSLGRWYPTVTMLGNGDLFTVGGFDEAGQRSEDSEIFDGTSWVNQQGLPPGMVDMPLYPGLHLKDDGRLFYSGTNSFGGVVGPPGIWDIGTNTFAPVPGLPDANRRDQGSSVLLPPAQDQKVMIMGGGNHFDANTLPTDSTAIIDLSQPNPAYVAGPPLDTAKIYVNAVILPDSTVLQTGGASTGIGGGDNPVNTAQIYRPASNTWSTVAAPSVGRTYHSSAMLLPDASVATIGSQPSFDNFETRIERYFPRYLTTGHPRPTITSAPSEVQYGGQYPITTTQASPLRSAVLVRPMAVTHQNDSNQRLVSLPLTTGPNPSITMPATGNDAPPGWYMLFVVDQRGIPSVASWVHLPDPTP